MQFLSENRVHRCKIFGWFGFFISESEPNIGFTPNSSENLQDNENKSVRTEDNSHNKLHHDTAVSKLYTKS